MATPTSLQRYARRALIIRAKSDAGLTALVPAASISPDGTAEWPFMLVASPRTLRLRASCVRGASVSFDVHAFAGPRYDTPDSETQQVVEIGYDHISRIGSAIETVFADNNLTLESGANCRIRFSDMQLLPDEKPDHWHWFSQLNCRVLSE